MKANWFPTVPILAVLAVPFGLAIFDDATRPDRGDSQRDSWDEYDDSIEIAAGEAAAVEAEPETMSDTFFEEVFFTGRGAEHPALSGALAELSFGQPRIDDDSSALVRWSDYGETPYEGAVLHVGYGHSGLELVSLSFPDDGSALALFAAQWGPADGSFDSAGVPVRTWLDENENTMARVDSDRGDCRVLFTPYLPLEQIVAPDKRKGLGFEGFPLLGSGRSAVLAKYRDALDEYETDDVSAHLVFPSNEYGDGPTHVYLTFSDSRVVAVEVQLNFGLAAAKRKDLVELLTRKLGKKPDIDDEYGEYVARFKGQPTVELRIPEYGAGATIQFNTN